VSVSKLDALGNYKWAFKLGQATSNDKGQDIKIASNGDIIVKGDFGDTVDFDPGPNVYNMISPSTSIFIARYDSNGSFIWAKQIDAIGNEGGTFNERMTLDQWDNIYFTGVIIGTFDCDPGAAVYNLTGSFEAFVAKLNSAGDFIWAKKFTSTIFSAGDLRADVISIDKSGNNIYVGGTFPNEVDFDPSANNAFITSIGYLDYFVCKLDSGGNYKWVKQIENNSSTRTMTMDVDDFGNIAFGGTISNNIDFDPGIGITTIPGSSIGLGDLFVEKLDSNGQFLWAKRINDTSNVYDKVRSITFDVNNNILLAGGFKGMVDFDPGIGFYHLMANALDPYICNLDANGNFKWVKQLKGNNNDLCHAIEIDLSGSIYALGWFRGTVDFNPDTVNVFNISSQSIYQDPFILKLNDCQIDNSVTVAGLTLTANQANATYQWMTCGEQGVAIAGATNQSYTSPTTGSYLVIVSYGNCKDTSVCTNTGPLSLQSTSSKNALSIYPNPSNGYFTIESEFDCDVEMIDIAGKILKAQKIYKGINQLNCARFASGIYFLKAKGRGEKMEFKIIIE
jgi:Secretion system C-terminal sorting domain